MTGDLIGDLTLRVRDGSRTPPVRARTPGAVAEANKMIETQRQRMKQQDRRMEEHCQRMEQSEGMSRRQDPQQHAVGQA